MKKTPKKKKRKDIHELTKDFEKIVERAGGYAEDGKDKFEKVVKEILKGKK